MSWIKKAKDPNKKEYQMPFVFYGSVIVEAVDEGEAEKLASQKVQLTFEQAKYFSWEGIKFKDYERQELEETSKWE